MVIGGQPSEKYDDGCTTKEEGTNNAGLWLFTREPKASKATLDAVVGLCELGVNPVALAEAVKALRTLSKRDGRYVLGRLIGFEGASWR